MLFKKKKRYFYEQNIGKSFKVLFESENDGNKMYGFTENYIKVECDYDPMLVNEIKDFKITGINAEGLAVGYVKVEVLHK